MLKNMKQIKEYEKYKTLLDQIIYWHDNFNKMNMFWCYVFVF